LKWLVVLNLPPCDIQWVEKTAKIQKKNPKKSKKNPKKIQKDHKNSKFWIFNPLCDVIKEHKVGRMTLHKTKLPLSQLVPTRENRD
jgi:hypothetical protein